MNENGQCARCKKAIPLGDLAPLSSRRLLFLSFGGIPLPDNERQKLYCPSCRRSLNLGVSFLAGVGILATIIWVLVRFGGD
jgi:hypothetical protein